jgi:hypothetical protein
MSGNYMFKKLLFLSLSFATMSVFSCEKPYRKSVQKAKSIIVKSTTGNHTIPIDYSTTVLDVKKQFKESQDIPTEQQTIDALYPNWSALNYMCCNSGSLADSTCIKDAMNFYNTDTFQLSLQFKTSDTSRK